MAFEMMFQNLINFSLGFAIDVVIVVEISIIFLDLGEDTLGIIRRQDIIIERCQALMDRLSKCNRIRCNIRSSAPAP